MTNGVASWIRISNSDSSKPIFLKRKRNLTNITPIKAPKTTPPIAATTKLTLASFTEKTPVKATPKATLNDTRPAASLINDSPSRTPIILVGSFTFFTIDFKATVSVGEIIAAKANEIAKGILGINQ